MRERLVHVPAFVAILVLVALAGAATAASAQPESPIQLVAMDADPSGNTATALGHLDPCIRTEPGAKVTVDLIVDAVPEDRPIFSFQIDVLYDPTILKVDALDLDFLLGANGEFKPGYIGDAVPDSDGDFTIAVLDFASNDPQGANMETGEGVLARVTLTAEATGTSDVAPGFNPPYAYPAIFDDQNTVIEVGSIAGVNVAVGEDCPSGPTEIQPTPLPGLPDLPTGTPWPTPTPVGPPSPEPTLLPPSSSPIELVAMDADPSVNTATTLGHLDPCVRTEPGSDVTVDLVVDAVPEDRPIISFQVEVTYNPAVLQVSAVDYDFLLGANGDFQPLEFQVDPLPDSDGHFTIAVLDLASNAGTPGANLETGQGVISRVTFSANEAGVSEVAPGFDLPNAYPALFDNWNTVIEVRSIAGIKVAVGEDCPPGPAEIQPTPLPRMCELLLECTPTPTLTPAPSPTPTPSPSPTASPAVLPAAFPATGGSLSGDASLLTWIGAVAGVFVLACAAAWAARRSPE